MIQKSCCWNVQKARHDFGMEGPGKTSIKRWHWIGAWRRCRICGRYADWSKEDSRWGRLVAWDMNDMGHEITQLGESQPVKAREFGLLVMLGRESVTRGGVMLSSMHLRKIKLSVGCRMDGRAENKCSSLKWQPSTFRSRHLKNCPNTQAH